MMFAPRYWNWLLAACLVAFGSQAFAGVESPGTPSAAKLQDADCQRLMDWLERFGHTGAFLTASLKEDCKDLVDKVASRTNGRADRAVEARRTLLTAAGWKLTDPEPPGVASVIRGYAQDALTTRLRPGRGDTFFDWLMQDVTPHPDQFSLEMRVVSLHALNTRMGMRATGTLEVEQILVALMMSARDPEPLVRQTAIGFLAQRTEDFVTDYFWGELERGQIAPETFLAHLTLLKATSTKAHNAWWDKREARVLTYVRSRLESTSWRETSCALAVAPLLDTAKIAPYLIQGLGVWASGELAGRVRVLSEFNEALAHLTERNYGPNASLWARWWQAETADGSFPENPTTETKPTFFGLAPKSDRVLFIIDRSGSMRESYRGRKSRYDQAIESLIYTLQNLGESTRFDVVLFASEATRFPLEFATVNPANLDRLKSWATDLGPGGGTSLRKGFEVAFPGLEAGTLAATDIPYDSVYILCDGETENPAWVSPWLLNYNVAARLTFHCVNIGGTPGGALEALAAGSGGAFVVNN